MVSYGAISDAEGDVVGALRREGGKLSLPELTDITHLPSGVVMDVVEHLTEIRKVHVLEQEGTGLKLIELQRSAKSNPIVGFSNQLLGWFRSKG